MEEKLTIEHYTPYLPYGLKVKALKKRYIAFNGAKPDCLIFEIETLRANYLGVVGYSGMYLYDDFKPIFHPLSDLTKEIEVNGEIFVPFDKLYLDSDLIFYDKRIYNLLNLTLSVRYNIVQQLLKWHFDIFGLIKEGLAIDINTF